MSWEDLVLEGAIWGSGREPREEAGAVVQAADRTSAGVGVGAVSSERSDRGSALRLAGSERAERGISSLSTWMDGEATSESEGPERKSQLGGQGAQKGCACCGSF